MADDKQSDKDIGGVFRKHICDQNEDFSAVNNGVTGSNAGNKYTIYTSTEDNPHDDGRAKRQRGVFTMHIYIPRLFGIYPWFGCFLFVLLANSFLVLAAFCSTILPLIQVYNQQST